MCYHCFLLCLFLIFPVQGEEDTTCSKPTDTCLDNSDCPPFQERFKEFNSKKKDAEAWLSLQKELKTWVCNKPERKVCCPNSEISTSGTCDLSLPSCLPAKGQCGVREPSARKIVGGTDTRPKEFPFTALLGTIKALRRVRGQLVEEPFWICGGTLINRWFVVTAAHCPDIQIVRLGEYQVTRDNARDCISGGSVCLPPVQDFNIKPEDFIKHPDYKITTRNVFNDIALIRLPFAASLNPAVQPVCLPINSVTAAAELKVSDLETGLEGTWPHVVGWGYTDPLSREGDVKAASVPSSVLQRLEVPVKNNTECGVTTLEDTQLCAGGERGKDSCKGDSGGPLYLKAVIPSSGRVGFSNTPWYLIGVVSYGTRVCGVGKPGVYTRVTSFIPWIQQIVGKAV